MAVESGRRNSMGPSIIKLTSRQSLHRSVPPINQEGEYKLYGSQIPAPRHVKTAPAPTRSFDGILRTRPRERTVPTIVDFDSSAFQPWEGRGPSRGVMGFFPPVKLRRSAGSERSEGIPQTPVPASTEMELAPTTGDEEPPPKTPANINLSQQQQQQQPLNPHTEPPPTARATVTSHGTRRGKRPVKRSDTEPMDVDNTLPVALGLPMTHVYRRDTPWVYCYKVKQRRNRFYKLLASKSASDTDRMKDFRT
ncbi:uncharacterized protein LOC118429530 [Branchiostoma floridae]|uniref:Uncharacterized protein LOC118429530 n=1 Tax=Branchiostoma floridae TaxID=7739 RepID=A0A9J7M7G1_BRAFL|nr:uncharacterized protein LOC118429530 [Branchiostoma floridae]